VFRLRMLGKVNTPQGLRRSVATPVRVARQPRFCENFAPAEDERKSRINTRRHARRLVQSQLPAVRAVTGFFWAFQSGVKIEGVISLLRSLSPKAYNHKEKIGVIPRKGAHFEQERKICPLSHP
jgi:hypothetical protein